MRIDICERCLMLGRYIVESRKPLREVAKHFDMKKSTVHFDVSKRLRAINMSLYQSVKIVLKNNFSDKHFRGGEATKNKYLLLKNAKN